MKEEVILVDEADRETGTAEKIEAHRKKLLHRAFSVFIFNDKDELVLQRRAKKKYHSGGLWTNTCCGHPRPGEETMEAAKRRLKEEMAMEAELEPVFRFTYSADFSNGLHEYELDHVFIGRCNKKPLPDPEEAMDVKTISWKELQKDSKTHPEKYTAWLLIFLQIERESKISFFRSLK